MTRHRYFLSDFIDIQRKSFFEFLEKGLIEEFSKRNPITNKKKTIEVFFYPEYYQLTRPEYDPREAILKTKSYSSRLYVPVQLTDKNLKIIKLKWVYIGDLPLMTKRGHFILNGAARVIVNQILRSPGIYYQKKLYENYLTKWTYKAESSYKRYYADLICQRGTWLRIEMDKDKQIWAQMKKGPKIPIMWFLIAMGLTEKIILKTIMDSDRLLFNMQEDSTKPNKKIYKYISNPPEAWSAIYSLFFKEREASTQNLKDLKVTPPQNIKGLKVNALFNPPLNFRGDKKAKKNNEKLSLTTKGKLVYKKSDVATSKSETLAISEKHISADLGRKWIFNKFMNPRTYDLGKAGRFNFNRKLNLHISENQTTLTPQDMLFATDYLIKVEKGLKNVDDIDHLKNRRVRTSGELIQIQLGTGLVRLEKIIRDKLNKFSFSQKQNYVGLAQNSFSAKPTLGVNFLKSSLNSKNFKNSFDKEKDVPLQRGIGASILSLTPNSLILEGNLGYAAKRKKGLTEDESHLDSQNRTKSVSSSGKAYNNFKNPNSAYKNYLKHKTAFKNVHKLNEISTYNVLEEAKKNKLPQKMKLSNKSTLKFLKKNKELEQLTISSLMTTKALNGALREFFGTSPLSQFMDQINPLSELTHKRRLSSMGPGGVTRDSATLAIRGIHPTHYGRICPVETPEGKNTGLVNSLTAYARVNSKGFIETPFYKVYKGQVQKKEGMFFFSADQEEKIKLGAADLFSSEIGFLPKANIPVRIVEEFTKIPRNVVQYVGVSPIQMISIATSLIPFLEHDDANRALMGSNMQRQAVPILKPERPIVGTGLEARAVSDSGHVIQAKCSGIVTYVSSEKIIVSSGSSC